MATKPASIGNPAPAPETADDRAARRAAFLATVPRDAPPSGISPGEAEAKGAIPAGGGSTPDPNDPAVTDPLGHLDDLPGVSESPPTPGAGLPPTDEVPAPEPPPPPPPPPPAAQTLKG